MRICKTLGENLQDFGRLWDLHGFIKLWKRVHRICKTLEEICQNLGDFRRGFARLHGRIWDTLGENLQDFGIGFIRLWETLGEDSQ